MNIPIDSITVLSRQRASAEVDDLFVASVARRLIHPIVLRRENGNDAPILVVGERRLKALAKIGLTELEEGTHFRFFEDLSETEAKTVELEENVKRSDLPWRDHVAAIAALHELYRAANPDWTVPRTAEELSLNKDHTAKILLINKNLASPMLRDCGGIKQAISILENVAERRIAAIIGDIAQAGNDIFETKDEGKDNENAPAQERNDENPNAVFDETGGDNTSEAPRQARDESGGIPNVGPIPQKALVKPAVLNIDFVRWIKSYSGPKFTLIHCDFPYDIEYKQYAKSKTSTDEDYEGVGSDFWILLDALCDNLDKIASYQSHLMFWFSMKFYERTRKRLIDANLVVHDHPLIWFKTDNAGIIPGTDGTWPRRIYETAFLCSRGKRSLVKPLANAYGAPTASNPVHPSQKPEPVLHHFFSMLVDDTTDVLDPTCGSGTALRAAEFVGARSVLGLELDPKYAETAEALTQNARALRRIHR